MTTNLTLRQQQIMHLAETLILTSSLLAWVLHWSQDTMRKELRTLAVMGLLESVGEKRGRRYRLCVK